MLSWHPVRPLRRLVFHSHWAFNQRILPQMNVACSTEHQILAKLMGGVTVGEGSPAHYRFVARQLFDGVLLSHTELGVKLNFYVRLFFSSHIPKLLNFHQSLSLAGQRTPLLRWVRLALCLLVCTTLKIDNRRFKHLSLFEMFICLHVSGTKIGTYFTIRKAHKAGLACVLIHTVVWILLISDIFVIFESLYNRVKNAIQARVVWWVPLIFTSNKCINFWQSRQGTAFLLDIELVVKQ